MENLPICEIPMNDAQYLKFLGTDKKVYSKDDDIGELIKGLVGSDCWAVSVNDKEVLFNNYTNYILNTTQYESFSYKNWIQGDIIQDAIIDNVHYSILVIFYRSKVDNHLDIYMFGDNSWKVRVSFKASDKTFIVQGFFSADAVANY